MTKDNCAAYVYTFRSAGTSSTHRNNLEPLGQWRFIESSLLCFATPQSVNLELPSSVLLAPVGLQGILHKDSELATAREEGRVEVSQIMSTASTRSIEPVAKANGNGHRWYRLCWPRSSDMSLSILDVQSSRRRRGASAAEARPRVVEGDGIGTVSDEGGPRVLAR